ncbi:carboxylating nicotinate-nucleotide diphosphorylase [Salinibacter altiplanensis]|uniref:carboxylating nicotinate-nucleotide diphosphorylase n=1 Tax=Salinibacter altiplanensis TaxID=1803181 RepID=UPI001E2CDE15|nr:carboxylating nicotinate-nucleotide diphosphorylase [Salinibacter altiplanensis]
MTEPTSVASPRDRARRALPEFLRRPSVLSLLSLSIAEDVDADGAWQSGKTAPSDRDVTSAATLKTDAQLHGRLVAKEEGVVAGLPLADALCRLVDPELRVAPSVEEGERVEAGHLLATVEGPGRALLTAERPAINFVGRLSGVATLTRRFVDAISHTKADILDTRKTLPGHRRPDKYAVRQGGGQNHRMGLYDMILIKDNHIDGAGGIAEAVRRVRETHGDTYPIEVEVKTLDELEEALSLAPDHLLLDNMSPETLRRAVDHTDGRVPLEASGGVTLKTVSTVAETGVDAVSVGALTHSPKTLDISMRID